MARHLVNITAYRKLMKPTWSIEVRRLSTEDYTSIIASTPVERAKLSICSGRMRYAHILHGSYDGPAWVDLVSADSSAFGRLLMGVLIVFADCLRRDPARISEVASFLAEANVFPDTVEHFRWIAERGCEP